MKEMLSSPTNIVLLLIAATGCVGFWFGKLDQESFMILASGVFGYFFGKVSDPSRPFGGK